jgi:hypothetical protein
MLVALNPCMRTIIAEYDSLTEAERAVHALEAKLSIQNVVIRNQMDRRWKRRDQRRDRSLDGEHSANFVVSMSGTVEGIERARVLFAYSSRCSSVKGLRREATASTYRGRPAPGHAAQRDLRS